MEKVYRHERDFLVKYCDVDFKDELKVSALLAYLEEVACSSADELGFGYDYVKPRGYAFMVANLALEFASPVPLGEKMHVVTWPTPPSRVVFGREYQIFSPTGTLRAAGSSRWCLIDFRSGKLLSSKVLEEQDYSTYNPEKALENVKWKIASFPLSEGELRFSIKIANSEYDHNMHVNNTRYADYCLNCFSVEDLKVRKLCGFAISYVKQCFEGETLRFYRKKEDEGENYLLLGVNEKDECVVQARASFVL